MPHNIIIYNHSCDVRSMLAIQPGHNWGTKTVLYQGKAWATWKCKVLPQSSLIWKLDAGMAQGMVFQPYGRLTLCNLDHHDHLPFSDNSGATPSSVLRHTINKTQNGNLILTSGCQKASVIHRTSRLLSKSGITPCRAEVVIVHDLSGKSQKVNPAHVTWAPHPVQWANLSPMRVPVQWLKPKELLWPDQRHLKEMQGLKPNKFISNNKDNHIPPCCWHGPSQSITIPLHILVLKKQMPRLRWHNLPKKVLDIFQLRQWW